MKLILQEFRSIIEGMCFKIRDFTSILKTFGTKETKRIAGLWSVLAGLIREKFEIIHEFIAFAFHMWNEQARQRRNNKQGTRKFYPESQKTTELDKPTDTTIQPVPKRQAERNQNPSHSNQMRCETCGKQLFVTQPFTYHREFYKFWCLRCHYQREQDSRHTQEESEDSHTQAVKHEVSEVPPMTDFLRPILRWASKRSSGFGLPEIAEAMADHFNLSSEAREERTGENNEYCFYNKTRRAINPHLKEAELVCSTHRGHYEITQAGKNEAFASDERMTFAYLMNKFPSYRRWKNKDK